jgi:hypothetical protein
MYRRIIHSLVYLFAFAGFFFIAGFFAIRWGFTNTAGMIDPENRHFQEANEQLTHKADAGLVDNNPVEREPDLRVESIVNEITRLSSIKDSRAENYCRLKLIGELYPANASKIVEAAEKTQSDLIVFKMIMAVELRLKDNFLYQDSARKCINVKKPIADFDALKSQYQTAGGNDIFTWVNDEEWKAIKEATVKDKDQITAVGVTTGVEPRLIVSSMIVEQLRLFHSQREVFKKFFEPLKILCNANKISLGVMGIKEATAIKVEDNLKDRSSPYYLGEEFEHMLDYRAGDVASTRYDRLVNEKDHYYSYLYGALYMKQLMTQWDNAGYSIEYRPEIMGTLFNVGFPQSIPKENPMVGGSHITIGDKEYSFGSLAYEFYYSGEMLDEFPFVIKN